MNMQELVQLSEKDLAKRLADARRELLVWEEKVMVGKEANHSKLRYLRRNIAQIHTALNGKLS